MSKRFCISIPVHEAPEVVVDQVNNILKYVPESYIILHVSLYGIQIRNKLKQIFKGSQRIFVNPTSYPTDWGWMFHTHIVNYGYAESLKLSYDYFVVDASNSMFFQHGIADFVKDADYFVNLRHVQDLGSDHWVVRNATLDDPCFRKMVQELEIKDLYVTRHEGNIFSRPLLTEMMRLFDKYYIMDVNEKRYPREEIYFSTICRHLSARHKNQITITKVLTPDDITALRELNSAQLLVTWPDLTDPHLFARSYFAVKPVGRALTDPLRKFINSLDPKPNLT